MPQNWPKLKLLIKSLSFNDEIPVVKYPRIFGDFELKDIFLIYAVMLLALPLVRRTFFLPDE